MKKLLVISLLSNLVCASAYMSAGRLVTPISISNGGLGLSSASQGDLIYGSSTNTYSLLPKNTTATRYLSNTGTTNNPAWAQINLTNGVTGTLPIANGGTNNTTFTSSKMIYFDGTKLANATNVVYSSNPQLQVTQSGGDLTALKLVSFDSVAGSGGGDLLMMHPSSGMAPFFGFDGVGRPYTATTVATISVMGMYPASCTSPSASISGTDVNGVITITTGTGCGGTAPAAMAAISFSTAFSTFPNSLPPKTVIITPANDFAADIRSYNGAVYVPPDSITTAGFEVWASVDLIESTVYRFYYWVIG